MGHVLNPISISSPSSLGKTTVTVPQHSTSSIREWISYFKFIAWWTICLACVLWNATCEESRHCYRATFQEHTRAQSPCRHRCHCTHLSDNAQFQTPSHHCIRKIWRFATGLEEYASDTHTKMFMFYAAPASPLHILDRSFGLFYTTVVIVICTSAVVVGSTGSSITCTTTSATVGVIAPGAFTPITTFDDITIIVRPSK